MSNWSDNSVLADLDDRTEREDPEFARGLASGHPVPPREYRQRRGWLLLAIALVALVVGIAVGHGLLIAAALALASIAVHLIERPPGR
jgi:hypothetical protein